ncbi:hypothetical protein U3A58_10215 [Algoriphagus sp. C2-6-M1]|nr:hypothetical protein [Algoriphagus sp. C2-6-M1]
MKPQFFEADRQFDLCAYNLDKTGIGHGNALAIKPERINETAISST